MTSGMVKRPLFKAHCSAKSPLSMSGSRSTTLPSWTTAFMLQWPAQRWQKVKTSLLDFAAAAKLACLAPWSGWMKASITG